jgi:hypothetical protein
LLISFIFTVAVMSRPKTYSTPEAAKLIGVSVIILHRWLGAQRIQPYGIELVDGRKLWRWNERDIAEGRKLKASQKDGPKTRLGSSDIAKRPRFQLLVSAKPRACMARYCPNEADYRAVWARDVRKLVCRSHRHALENKPWKDISEWLR